MAGNFEHVAVVPGIGDEELGRAQLDVFIGHHAPPEVQGQSRVIARLGHEDEPDLIGLQLLGGAVNGQDPMLDSQAVTLTDGLAGYTAHPAQPQADTQAPHVGHRGLALPLRGMAGQGVAHLMGQHRGQARLIPGVLQGAGEDTRLAPGEAKGAGLLGVFQDHKLPMIIGAVGRGGQAVAHPGHQLVHGRVLAGFIVGAQIVVGLGGGGELAFFGFQDHLAPAGIGRGGAAGYQEGEPERQTHDYSCSTLGTPGRRPY